MFNIYPGIPIHTRLDCAPHPESPPATSVSCTQGVLFLCDCCILRISGFP